LLINCVLSFSFLLLAPAFAERLLQAGKRKERKEKGATKTAISTRAVASHALARNGHTFRGRQPHSKPVV
jgi:hypothetical protein